MVCSCVIVTTLFCVRIADRLRVINIKTNYRKYILICQCVANQLFAEDDALRQILDLHVTDKSRYFAQPRSIIFRFLTLTAKYGKLLHGSEKN